MLGDNVDLSLIPPDPTEYMAAKQGKFIQDPSFFLFFSLECLLQGLYNAGSRNLMFFSLVRNLY